jgi:small subunit ribosomal protein S21
MLIIKVKKGENIDIALKRYKFKYRKVKIAENIRANKEYKKPSVKKREQKQKAIYVNKLRLDDE